MITAKQIAEWRKAFADENPDNFGQTIVIATNNFLKLLDELERLQKEIAELKEEWC